MPGASPRVHVWIRPKRQRYLLFCPLLRVRCIAFLRRSCIWRKNATAFSTATTGFSFRFCFVIVNLLLKGGRVAQIWSSNSRSQDCQLRPARHVHSLWSAAHRFDTNGWRIESLLGTDYILTAIDINAWSHFEDAPPRYRVSSKCHARRKINFMFLTVVERRF